MSAAHFLLQLPHFMNHLWSPWRMTYIENNEERTGCVFCVAQALPDNSENLIAYRGELAYVILNRYPYTSGHVMAVPFAHKAELHEFDARTRAELMELTSKATEVLRKVYRPQGFNLGANIGEAAGAGVVGHLHVHIVPRWGGDTNFMSTLAETRVLPESLEDSYKRVRAAFETQFGRGK